MISTEEVKKILQLKKTELNQEKQQMGLIVKQDYCINAENKTEPNKIPDLDKLEDPHIPTIYHKTEIGVNNGSRSGLEDQELPRTSPMPPEVAKYMRRQAGLPLAMLKTGEYSPNHPLLLRQPDTAGNGFLGFGEYEEQKKKFRKLRQQEYREYLDKQNEQRQQQKSLQQAEAKKTDIAEQNYRPVRYSDSTVEIQNSCARRHQPQNGSDKQSINQNICSTQNTCHTSYTFDKLGPRSSGDQNNVLTSSRTVDSTTQCDDLGYYGQRKPSSVAVQTDETELDKLSENFKVRRSSETNMQAERELSPRTVLENNTLMVPHSQQRQLSQHSQHYNSWRQRSDGLSNTEHYLNTNDARSDVQVKDGGYSSTRGVAEEESPGVEWRSSARTRLLQDLRHSYMPSILDADVIQRRNLKAEQEAAAKRESYQEELRHQIVEQQRIKEERKAREKLLEQAELRRLEQQLRTLQLAQDNEKEKQDKITTDIRDNNKQYQRTSDHLQREIIEESKNLQRAKSHSNTRTQEGNLTAKTWRSDHDKPKPSNLPLYYAYKPTRKETELKLPKYNSSYLSMNSVPYRSDSKYGTENELDQDNCKKIDVNDNENIVERSRHDNRLSVSEYRPSFLNKDISELIVRRKSDFDVDSLPIPVLRHSSKNFNDKIQESYSDIDLVEKSKDKNSSDAMKKVESKWQIPIVQRNIVRSVPEVEGRSGNGSILTQLGSIRRQLQLEQLKLDKMLAKND